METLEQLQNDDPVYETGIGALQSGLRESGFGVEIPRLDVEETWDSITEHRGSLTGVMAAIAMGSLALAAPSGVSAEQADSAPGIVTTTTEQYNPNQIDHVKVVPQKYKKINSRCGVESFKISSTAGKLEHFGAVILSDSAPKHYGYIRRTEVTLDETGILMPVRVCHVKNSPSGAILSMNTDFKDFIFKNYVFNWPKKKWIIKDTIKDISANKV